MYLLVKRMHLNSTGQHVFNKLSCSN